MSVNDFLTKKNFEVIWEVVKEYELVNNNQKIMEQVNLFIQQIMPEFYEVEKRNLSNLKEMNKKCIIYIINYINNYFSSQKYEDSKISIKSKQMPQVQTPQVQTPQAQAKLVTFEEIQKERQSIFEKQLSEKQKDFSEFIKINIPPTPNFSDNIDQPLSETENLVEKMKQQRFLEEETFKNTTLNMNSSENGNKNWLKSQETSVKKEKIINNSNVPLNNPIKYIKIENNILSYGIENKDIINLDSNSNSNNNSNNDNEINTNSKNDEKKHISWKDDNITMIVNEKSNEENNIFSKLKKVNPTPIKKVVALTESNINSNVLEEEVKIIKDEMKTIHSKMKELDETMNNVLAYLKSKNISLS